jgi:mRNA-degrading endonuclease RelE of RelBE toxin-antitoxin system
MILAHAVAEKNIRNAMVKKLRIIIPVLLLVAGYTSSAQVTVDVPEQINVELRMKNASIDSTKVSGFRIQIAFNSDMSKASKAKTKFRMRFPDYSSRAYLLYQQPYWKVRVGDFYKEIDAQKLLEEVRVHFPDAFVVKDYIQRPLL